MQGRIPLILRASLPSALGLVASCFAALFAAPLARAAPGPPRLIEPLPPPSLLERPAGLPFELTDPLLDAFGLDRYQTPQIERSPGAFFAGRFGPSRWRLVPSLSLDPAEPSDDDRAPLPPWTMSLSSAFLASGERLEARLAYAAWRPPPRKTCRRRPATFVRYGGESDAFLLTDCDGAIREDALDRLSLLARPPGAERPALPLPETPDPAALAQGEWVEHIKLLPPRLIWALQRIAEAFPFRPIYVISGYRPGGHGGFHAHGKAIDLFVMNVPNERVYKVCRKLPDMGCGYYPHNLFVHIDIRPPGTGKAYWIDDSMPGEPSHYVDSWPGVEKGGAAVWMGN